MLKLWCPAQLPLVSGCQNSSAPPHTFLTVHFTGVDCIFALVRPVKRSPNPQNSFTQPEVSQSPLSWETR